MNYEGNGNYFGASFISFKGNHPPRLEAEEHLPESERRGGEDWGFRTGQEGAAGVLHRTTVAGHSGRHRAKVS